MKRSKAQSSPNLDASVSCTDKDRSVATDAYLLAALRKLTEHDLTHAYLIPLFEALGYSRVEYHGGPNEMGKDLVLWNHDCYGEIELTVAQIKKFRFTGRSADPNSFAGIVTQLSQAFQEPVPNVNGSKYLPDKVLLISPYTLNTRILQTHFAEFRSLRSTGLRILDGPKILNYI